MKQFILFLAAIISLYACSSSTTERGKDNLALVKKYIHAVETNDSTSMNEVLADTYKGYGPSVNDSVNKSEAIANWQYNTRHLYESIKYSRFQNIAITVKDHEEAEAGDWVSTWAYLTIKYKDGRGPVHVYANSAYKIENGKIIRSRTFYNEADVLRQLGYKLLPPENEK